MGKENSNITLSLTLCADSLLVISQSTVTSWQAQDS